MNVLNPKLDYITLKSTQSLSPMFELVHPSVTALGLDIDDAEFTNFANKKAYFFREMGIDVKILKYHIEIEFHSTFFASTENALKVIQGFCQYLRELGGIIFRPTRIDVARDVIDYPISDFYEVCSDLDNHSFSFKALTWLRQVKDGEVESIYLKGPKYRWNLCVYDKTKELKSNWSKMTELKKSHYQSYLNQNVVRFELRVRGEFIKSNVIEDFYLTNDETHFCLSILGSWSQRRKIFKHIEGSLKGREILDIFRAVFITDMKSQGNRELLVSSPVKLLNIEDAKKKISNILLKSELEGEITSHEINQYTSEVKRELEARENRYRSGCEYLSSLILGENFAENNIGKF